MSDHIFTMQTLIPWMCSGNETSNSVTQYAAVQLIPLYRWGICRCGVQ